MTARAVTATVGIDAGERQTRRQHPSAGLTYPPATIAAPAAVAPFAVTIDQDVRDYAKDVSVCVWSDTVVDSTGFRRTLVGEQTLVDRAYAIPGLGLVVFPDSMVRLWHEQRGALGVPIDYPRLDGRVWFLNFEGGHITAESAARGTTNPKAMIGHRYEPITRIGDCRLTDRPCVVAAERTDKALTVVWSYPDADAFNVVWWAERSRPGKGVEVATHNYTIRDSDPRRMHGFSVQACRKRFLGRSDCTQWYSVILPARSLPDPGSAGVGRR